MGGSRGGEGLGSGWGGGSRGGGSLGGPTFERRCCQDVGCFINHVITLVNLTKSTTFNCVFLRPSRNPKHQVPLNRKLSPTQIYLFLCLILYRAQK